MTSGEPAVIPRAVPEEAPLVNELTGRTALYWGDEPEFLDWEPESITVYPEVIATWPVYVLEEAGRVLGYYSLTGQPPTMVLDKLFVEPDRIGTGCGKRLWRHAVATARAMGATAITLDADPNAAPFYRAMGAVWQREVPTSRPGWALQVFHFPIPPPDAAERQPGDG